MTFLLYGPGWCVHKSDVQNKWDDNTHVHTNMHSYIQEIIQKYRLHTSGMYLEDYWPCAGELSTVNAIEDSGRNPVSKHQIQPEPGERGG